MDKEETKVQKLNSIELMILLYKLTIKTVKDNIDIAKDIKKKIKNKELKNLDEKNLNMAYDLISKKEYEGAKMRLYIAMIFNQKNPEIFYNLANIFFLEQKYKKSRKLIARCLALKSNHSEAINLNEKIKKNDRFL